VTGVFCKNGWRAVAGQPATPGDLREMAELAKEAIAARRGQVGNREADRDRVWSRFA